MTRQHLLTWRNDDGSESVSLGYGDTREAALNDALSRLPKWVVVTRSTPLDLNEDSEDA